MKLKNLRKKVRRLEKWLQEGPKKLARLRQKLQAAQAKAMKAARRKPAARATPATRPSPKPSMPIETKSPTQTSKKPTASKKAKRKLNLSPERRAQLAAATKATWAAKRAAEASATRASADDQHSAANSPPQTPELAPPLAGVPMPHEAARLTEPSEEIRLRAYFISEHRRRYALPGDADSDWREAKQQLLSKSGELSGRSTITAEEPSEIPAHTEG